MTIKTITPKANWMQTPAQLWQANAGEGEKTYTQADIDKLAASVEALEAKNTELIADVRKAKQQARAASEIKPEDMAAVEAERDKALADLAALGKQVKTLTKERDDAAKALEIADSMHRTERVDRELGDVMRDSEVIPQLVDGFRAMWSSRSTVDVVDGKPVVMIDGKPAREVLKEFLDGESGKHWKAAPMNGGGGAPGGGGQASAKTVTRSQFDGMSHVERSSFAKDGGKVVDEAA